MVFIEAACGAFEAGHFIEVGHFRFIGHYIAHKSAFLLVQMVALISGKVSLVYRVIRTTCL
jgi:hypothetical protein